MLIREIRETDAAAFVELQKKLDEETRFMLFEPGERKITAEQMQKKIEETHRQSNSTYFVAETEQGALVGFLAAFGGQAIRNRHNVYLVIGVRETYQSRGIGTQLFQTLHQWAIEAGVHRLELNVMTHNEKGIALYKKMGFAIEGTKRHTLLIDGEFVDEYQMAKLLPL